MSFILLTCEFVFWSCLFFVPVDLVNEKERESASFKELREQLQTEMTSLRKELEATKEEASAKSQVNSEELLQRLESEKANIHTEYEQERIAYQKLLKAYNRLEVQVLVQHNNSISP